MPETPAATRSQHSGRRCRPRRARGAAEAQRTDQQLARAEAVGEIAHRQLRRDRDDGVDRQRQAELDKPDAPAPFQQREQAAATPACGNARQNAPPTPARPRETRCAGRAFRPGRSPPPLSSCACLVRPALPTGFSGWRVRRQSAAANFGTRPPERQPCANGARPNGVARRAFRYARPFFLRRPPRHRSAAVKPPPRPRSADGRIRRAPPRRHKRVRAGAR